MVIIILQCTKQFYTTKSFLVQNVNSAKAEKLWTSPLKKFPAAYTNEAGGDGHSEYNENMPEGALSFF